ncbi:hypothetical protein LguiA_017608 [Lonicera macranthoides]
MSDADLAGESNTAPSVIEQLGKAFLELEAHNDVREEKILWKEIEDHFHHLETVMENKSSEIESMEKAFKEEESYFTSLLAEREAAVAAKEQDMLDQIQELKDAAVAAIKEAGANHQPEQETMDVEDGKESKVSASIGDTNAHFTDPEEESPHKTGENADGAAPPAEVIKPRPELTQLCVQMDAKGLLNFITENQNNIREELSFALESATEPGRLVLASLEGFYPPNGTTREGDKKDDTALQGTHVSCLVILEAMATLLARADPSGEKFLNPEIKQQAKGISDAWKPKLADAGIINNNAANGNSLEAQAFLQILATFKIASEFDEEELCKLVLAASQHRQAPALCRSLGLTHKIPGIVEALNERGKQIDAVHFVHEFHLTESYPLASLLRTYLKDLRRNAQGKGSKLGNATGGQNDANAQELAAVKAVIQCIQEYKLEAEYPLDPLQRRAAQLDRSLKPDRKRFVDTGKPQQFKKPRANGGFFGARAAPGPTPGPAGTGRPAPPVYGERGGAYAGIAERYPVSAAYNYQAAPSQQGYDQRPYYYPQDERVTAATGYNPTQASYGGYTTHQPYM